jgi:hypothetical protein
MHNASEPTMAQIMMMQMQQQMQMQLQSQEQARIQSQQQFQMMMMMLAPRGGEQKRRENVSSQQSNYFSLGSFDHASLLPDSSSFSSSTSGANYNNTRDPEQEGDY